MKKHHFITLAACLFTLGTTAQPVITYNGNGPQIGDVFHEAGAMVAVDPGPAGGNQSWDFSDISPTDTYSFKVVSSESTPFAAEFPEATMAYQDLLTSNDSYVYLKVTDSEMLNVGTGFDPGADQTVFHYTDAIKQMQYPFSFSDSYTDTYFQTYIITGNIIVRQSGTITVTADAWGSIKTPGGTFNNTLRLKKVRVHTDSVFSNGVLMSAKTSTITDYEWYTSNSRYPVAQVVVDEAGTSLVYTTSGDGIKNNPLTAQVKIYPNPATDMVNFDLPDGITGEVEMDLVNTSGKKLLKLKKTGNRRFSADVSRLSPGIYFIKINNGEGNSISVKFIKR